MADFRLKVNDADATPQFIDNEAVTNDQAQAALRQHVSTPDAARLLSGVESFLQALVCRKGQRDPVIDADRCTIVGGTLPNVTTVGTVTTVATVTTLTTCTTVGTVTTCSTVTSVTALQNVVNVGGQPAANDYLIANRLLALSQIQAGVTVT